MPHLHQQLADRLKDWRGQGYPCPGFPALAEVMEWATDTENGSLRFLRRPQLEALETYWYLRVVENTPHVFDLYTRFFSADDDPDALLEALGIPMPAFKAAKYRIERVFERIATDDEYVRTYRLEALRETLGLGYPSYILALAMGAGKTILIGAIIATEFAMALEYPDGPFVENALVFAPGKTIIESLREILQIPYDKILPPRLYKPFAASVKITFTRDGEKDIPVIRGSSFNVVVTNTEKIRIQKETIRKGDLFGSLARGKEDEAKVEIANLRLQAIASLPKLAVFSDEAHHTYGQSLDKELKKVRKTVDYLAASTSVVCVVNTTGTPYFQRQPLKDVVYWYGLSQGIKDGILKDLAGSIQAYEFSGDAGKYVGHVVKDFFKDYGAVALPNGNPAKLAIYFPQTDDLKELRPAIEQALVAVEESPTKILVNTSDESLTKQADIDAFNRLNDPSSPHRVILLVNKGTEGWNCPSLFACALARKLVTSNNFVLQAATRCLRQVPGNRAKARVYLSRDNFGILDRQLQETYGETISDLNRTGQESFRTEIVLQKLPLPKLVFTQTVRTVVRKEGVAEVLNLQAPAGAAVLMKKTTYTMAEQQATYSVLQQVGGSTVILSDDETLDAYSAAVQLSGRYRVDLWQVYDELRRLYGGKPIPALHVEPLAGQVEEQVKQYEVCEEHIEVALALVKPEGFKVTSDAMGNEVYTTEISFPKDRLDLLLPLDRVTAENPLGFGFHYSPYNFDSGPELSFFEQMLVMLNTSPDEVEDIYYTGGITDPGKTDLYVEYHDEDGKPHRYIPDFVVRKKSQRAGEAGKVLIVEIKKAHDKEHPIDGEKGRKAMAMHSWESVNPDRLKYEIVFTDADTVTPDDMAGVTQFVEGTR